MNQVISYDELFITDGENEVGPELLGLHALFPFVLYDSTTRSQMCSSMFQQRVVLDDPDAQRIVSGFDLKMAKHLNDIRMPEDGVILKIIKMYPENYGGLSVSNNPCSLIIYQNEDGVIDCFEELSFISQHPEFGYRLKPRPEINELTPGNYIKKDTIFKASSSLGENGEFKFGVRAKTVHVNALDASEDAVTIRKGFAEKLKFRMYHKITIGMGSQNFPLNLYGDEKRYQPFPNIGEFIRDDGLVMALRPYQDDMAPALMHPEALREPDPMFDQLRYLVQNPKRPGETKEDLSHTKSRGKVVYIRVFKNPQVNERMPEKFTEQLEAYHRAYRHYLQEIIEFDKDTTMQYRRQYGHNARPNYGPKLQATIAYAYCILDAYNGVKHGASTKIGFVDKKVPFDEWNVEMVVEYVVTPTIGFKFTGLHGDKGVACEVVDDDEMFKDEFGRVADMVTYSASTVNRMCVGRAYELYLNDTIEQIEFKVRKMLGFEILKPTKIDFDEFIETISSRLIEEAFEYINGFFKLINPKQHEFYSKLDFTGKAHVVHGAVYDTLTLHLPQDIPIKLYKAVQLIEQSIYKPKVGKLTIKGRDGVIRKTIKDIAIGDQYIMVLNKIANTWNSVDVPLLQSHGVISSITENEKISHPHRPGAVRIIGEAESNIVAAFAGPEAIAEIMDRSTNPEAMREIINQLLHAEQPNNLERVIDRDKHEYGHNRPLQLFLHKLSCYGIKLKYVEDPKSEL